VIGRRTTLLVDSQWLDNSRKGEVHLKVQEELQVARGEASFGPIQRERLVKRPLARLCATGQGKKEDRFL